MERIIELLTNNSRGGLFTAIMTTLFGWLPSFCMTKVMMVVFSPIMLFTNLEVDMTFIGAAVYIEQILKIVSLLVGIFLSIVLLHINIPKWREMIKKKKQIIKKPKS